MVRKTAIYEALEYIYIYIAILNSGNILFVTADNVQKIIEFGILVILYSVFTWNRRKKNYAIKTDELLFVTICIILLIFSSIVNLNGKQTTYVHFLFRIFISMLFAKGIGFENFRDKYLNILTFLAFISLIFFGAYQLQPTFVNHFHDIYIPSYEGNTSTYVNAFYLYTFIVPTHYGKASVWNFRRNNGPFWEPGALQFYLILALVFLLENMQKGKRNNLKFFILFITIITTGSSAGLVGLIAVCMIYHKEIRKFINYNVTNHSVFVICSFVFLICGIAVGSEYLFGLVSKFGNELGENRIASRIGLANFSALLKQGLLPFMFGLGGPAKAILGITSDNTYITVMIMYGILFAAFFIWKFYKQYKKLFRKPIGAFLILILGFSSEVLMNMPIVLALLFLQNDTKKQGRLKKESIEKKI